MRRAEREQNQHIHAWGGKFMVPIPVPEVIACSFSQPDIAGTCGLPRL